MIPQKFFYFVNGSIMGIDSLMKELPDRFGVFLNKDSHIMDGQILFCHEKF